MRTGAKRYMSARIVAGLVVEKLDGFPRVGVDWLSVPDFLDEVLGSYRDVRGGIVGLVQES